MSVVVCSLVAEGNIDRLRDSLLACPGEDVATMQDYDFRTPLHFAAKHGHADIVRFLIQRGANVNAMDRWQQTPFYEAVTNLQIKVVKILS